MEENRDEDELKIKKVYARSLHINRVRVVSHQLSKFEYGTQSVRVTL